MSDNTQLTEADLTTMTPKQINDARLAGRFADLLRLPDEEPPVVLVRIDLPQ